MDEDNPPRFARFRAMSDLRDAYHSPRYDEDVGNRVSVNEKYPRGSAVIFAESLFNLLEQARGRKTTDPRDVVFG